jgi:gluconate 2-dehydrogenase gamma chain
MRRRKFLGVGVSAAVAGTTVSCSHSVDSWRILTSEQARTVEAICDRIIPADQDPGAIAAGVVCFIDRQLATSLRELQPIYTLGLAGVDQASEAMHGRRFVQLSLEQRVEVLKRMEADSAPGEAWKRVPARQFFDLLVSHSMQGFYGDPRHGGNRDYASWNMLGVSYPPVRGRQTGSTKRL